MGFYASPQTKVPKRWVAVEELKLPEYGYTVNDVVSELWYLNLRSLTASQQKDHKCHSVGLEKLLYRQTYGWHEQLIVAVFMFQNGVRTPRAYGVVKARHLRQSTVN